jgi:hypothetical protein
MTPRPISRGVGVGEICGKVPGKEEQREKGEKNGHFSLITTKSQWLNERNSF